MLIPPELAKKLENLIYPAFRILIGVLFLLHGVGKIFDVTVFNHGGKAPEVMSQLWIGGVIELVGGGAIALGLFTRVAAFLCSGQMAVAYIQFHWKLQFDKNFWPIVNGGEDTVMYCFTFLYFVARGSGPASLDRKLGLETASP